MCTVHYTVHTMRSPLSYPFRHTKLKRPCGAGLDWHRNDTLETAENGCVCVCVCVCVC